MPNGISCLFFAGRNFVYGAKEDNLFKSGVGAIQTVRTADFLAQSETVNQMVSGTSAASGTTSLLIKKNPVLAALGETAKILKKILYPLFIASGIYNTVKSDDKVKTGVSQASGIASMYGFEKVAERILPKIEKNLLSKPVVKNNKWAQVGVYIARGMAYAGISLLGYNTGSKVAGKSVDAIRSLKEEKTYKKDLDNQLNGVFNTPQDSIGVPAETNVFEDIESIF